MPLASQERSGLAPAELAPDQDDAELQGPTYEFQCLSVLWEGLEERLNALGAEGWMCVPFPTMRQSADDELLRLLAWRVSGWCVYASPPAPTEG